MKSAHLSIGLFSVVLMSQSSAQNCATDFIPADHRPVFEAEVLRVGGVFTLTMRAFGFFCAYTLLLDKPEWSIGEGIFDITIYHTDSGYPGCQVPDRRYVFPAPRNPGTYRVRVFGVYLPNPAPVPFQYCEQTIEVLPPLPIPTLHPALQAFLALSMLGVGLVFARRMPTP